jgi:GTP-binding protein
VDQIGAPPADFYEFYELGFAEDPVAVSSVHGNGTGDLLDAVIKYLPENDDDDDSESDYIKVAVIGRPNAGKSSIVNNILGMQRMIVSDIPGTTRDAIDTPLVNEFGKYTIIDTAGIRRQSRIDNRIEKYCVLRAKMAVERADVCIIVIDAAEGITEQDERIAGIAHESGKASIIAVNKWDLIEKDNDTVYKFTKDIYNSLAYMTYAPLLFVSALTGQRIVKLFENINYVNNQSLLRLSTGMLNDVLNDSTSKVQPPTDKGRRLKIYYITQTGIKPPTFVIFCNSAELFHYSYQRYIENQLREVFGFKGTPLKLIIRQKSDQQ